MVYEWCILCEYVGLGYFFLSVVYYGFFFWVVFMWCVLCLFCMMVCCWCGLFGLYLNVGVLVSIIGWW